MMETKCKRSGEIAKTGLLSWSQGPESKDLRNRMGKLAGCARDFLTLNSVGLAEVTPIHVLEKRRISLPT